jgi:hypothetical protein
MPPRSHFFWGAIAGLAVANIAAFVLPMHILNLEQHGWPIRGYASFAGVGTLLLCLFAQRHWRVQLEWFWSIAALSFILFAFALWLMVAGDAHDGPLAAEHFAGALPNLVKFAPAWVISQATLAFLLLSYALAGRRWD